MRARRTDANLTEIVKHLRSLGCSVHITNGDWDLTIGYGGVTFLAEVKDGSKPPSCQKLTENEKKFHDSWTGGIYMIRSIEDASNLANTMSKLCGK